MPIKPENAKRYPKDWKQIRLQVLQRACYHCEQCGIRQYSTGYRDENGSFIHAASEGHCTGYKFIRIVLTIAHLDHTPENCALDNLRAWCQKCHLTYDAKHHAINAHQTRKNRKAMAELF